MSIRSNSLFSLLKLFTVSIPDREFERFAGRSWIMMLILDGLHQFLQRLYFVGDRVLGTPPKVEDPIVVRRDAKVVK